MNKQNKPEFFKYEGISFNGNQIRKFENKQAFLKQAEKQFNWFPKDPKRMEKFGDVWDLASK